mmetsp:Transcript_112068/g.347776  ORF Transcript_112068/g.347776 Transcript_112068/m.347776 type:complete len:254 (+) Transcript_112068:42-803(+)
MRPAGSEAELAPWRRTHWHACLLLGDAALPHGSWRRHRRRHGRDHLPRPRVGHRRCLRLPWPHGLRRCLRQRLQRAAERCRRRRCDRLVAQLLCAGVVRLAGRRGAVRPCSRLAALCRALVVRLPRALMAQLACALPVQLPGILVAGRHRNLMAQRRCGILVCRSPDCSRPLLERLACTRLLCNWPWVQVGRRWRRCHWPRGWRFGSTRAGGNGRGLGGLGHEGRHAAQAASFMPRAGWSRRPWRRHHARAAW